MIPYITAELQWRFDFQRIR